MGSSRRQIAFLAILRFRRVCETSKKKTRPSSIFPGRQWPWRFPLQTFQFGFTPSKNSQHPSHEPLSAPEIKVGPSSGNLIKQLILLFSKLCTRYTHARTRERDAPKFQNLEANEGRSRNVGGGGAEREFNRGQYGNLPEFIRRPKDGAASLVSLMESLVNLGRTPLPFSPPKGVNLGVGTGAIQSATQWPSIPWHPTKVQPSKGNYINFLLLFFPLKGKSYVFPSREAKEIKMSKNNNNHLTKSLSKLQ